MQVLEQSTQHVAQNEEESFYPSYSWCLNPILSVRQLFDHLQEELERYQILRISWQFEEVRINLFLLACAIACAADDYLSEYSWALMPLAATHPRVRPALLTIQNLLNFPHSVRTAPWRYSLQLWQRRWVPFLEGVCQLLLTGDDNAAKTVQTLREDFCALRASALPQDFLRRRMKLNEGFRCQDLTHHDIVTLADRFCQSHPHRNAKIVVIGARTAGAYFAPLVRMRLLQHGYAHVAWATVRPRKKLSRLENHHLTHMLDRDTRVILTDDYPQTGETLRLLQNKLRRFGVSAAHVTILSPIHPTRPRVHLAVSPSTEVIILDHSSLHKAAFLQPRTIQRLFDEYFSDSNGREVSIEEDSHIEQVNERLWRQYPSGFNVRLKRVYDLQITQNGRVLTHRRIFAKSVGWGWLGYHAYLAGKRLNEFVPEVIGLRHGILFSEWMEGHPEDPNDASEDRLVRISSYVACRADRLALPEDPRIEGPDRGWGWGEILRILRRAYGVRLGFLKQTVLLDRLHYAISPKPALIDGRMSPQEWLVTDRGTFKLDFEHHNFGAPNLDVVDPAFDLASACLEFQLPSATEERMLQYYVECTGDRTVSDRLVLYKLLHASMGKRHALERVQQEDVDDKREIWNQQYLFNWNNLVFTMNHFCSSLIAVPPEPAIDGPLVFLDLDGVLDAEVLGFPHTSISGLRALTLLQSAGYSILPNTGRSVEHVRNYCQQYGFAGGIAEYGSVFVSSSRDADVSLVHTETAHELHRCRSALGEIPGVYLDAGYHYAIRAYRFNTTGTVGLAQEEAQGVLENARLRRLKCIVRQADTYFVGKENSKANALRHVAARFRRPSDPVIAIGDSDEDLSMLEAVDRAFAPANCSKGIRNLAKLGKCYVDSRPRQRGLLHIAEKLAGNMGLRGPASSVDSGEEHTVHNLIFTLLQAAEQSKGRKLLTVLEWRNL